MIIGVDIGGTKTLVAALAGSAESKDTFHFKTPQDQLEAVEEIAGHIKKLGGYQSADCIVIGAPGVIDTTTRKILACGNLPWKNFDLVGSLKDYFGMPIYIANDAKLAGLSEARALKLKGTTLYLTVSTGINSAIMHDGNLVPALDQSEAGQMMLKSGDEYLVWEKFASGHALYDLYHKKAEKIHDDAIWYRVSEALVPGILVLMATIQPGSIIIGGSIGTYFERYARHLRELLESSNESDLVQVPELVGALHAEKAVLYGCYEYGKDQTN